MSAVHKDIQEHRGERTGVWLVGGRGSVATTAMVGAAAVRAGAAATGCVTCGEPFQELPLPGFGDLVFGGHDIGDVPLPKRAEQLAAAGVFPRELPALVHHELLAAEGELRIGVEDAAAGSQAAEIERLAADLTAFRERLDLARVVVVNVATTEARPSRSPEGVSLSRLRRALADGTSRLPASSLYACAAFRAGCAYVDFTPSTGARLPALDELARERGLPYAGSDGKTGETLVKAVLAPMFARRALRVTSWSGTNLLGGGDGAALAAPDRARSKAASKGLVLEHLLGHPVEGGVHIHHLPDLGEWKTAWDHIAFEGFLGTRMTMQFTWQGCDSALAAPLVLDLARLISLAHRAGVGGAVSELGFFFKDPAGGGSHALEEQYTALLAWARRLGTAVGS
ncbi:inositol-3-phosphate synthase [Streptomyces sp. NPDC059690]|uniref:inositol-3-phosphate synthase n=1 Tax=Streptomyces sp. NPDC059690 TaxID=3346907 RepID=UPI0036B68C29